ncbi:hypothetical protein COP1_013842 [Malus domestica]
MPFGLKNAGATYQRLVNTMFKKQIGIIIEVYVDDIMVNGKQRSDHIHNLAETFNILRKYKIKLNPTKCTFGVSLGRFLGYLVTQRGTEAHPKQIQAILKMKSPTTLKEIQSLTGRAAALNRFLSRSTDQCKPFFKAIKRAQQDKWDEECEKAFQYLKKYLTSPPLLSKPKAAEDLYIYQVVSKVEVSSALIPEATEHTLAMLAPSSKNFWHLHINGASNYKGSGAGVVLVTPDGSMLEQVITLGFKASNNEAEYEALLVGL